MTRHILTQDYGDMESKKEGEERNREERGRKGRKQGAKKVGGR